jgi:hypothetical protein
MISIPYCSIGDNPYALVYWRPKMFLLTTMQVHENWEVLSFWQAPRTWNCEDCKSGNILLLRNISNLSVALVRMSTKRSQIHMTNPLYIDCFIFQWVSLFLWTKILCIGSNNSQIKVITLIIYKYIGAWIFRHCKMIKVVTLICEGLLYVLHCSN